MKICQAFHYIFIIPLLLLLSDASRCELAPKLITHIQYGSHAEQIGVVWAKGPGEGDNPDSLGPRGMAIDSNGEIYIGDYVNGAIKRYSASGQLLSVTEGTINQLQSFWLSIEGDIYVRAEEKYSEVIRFDKLGHRIWSHTFSEIIPMDISKQLENRYGAKYHVFDVEITAGPEGTVLLSATGQLPNGQSGKTISIIIDKEGKYVTELPYFGYEAEGVWWQYSIAQSSKEGKLPLVTATVYSRNSTVLRTIDIDTQLNPIRYQYITQDSSIRIHPDQNGGTFIVTKMKRKDPVKIGNIAMIYRDYIIDRYDINGRFVERLQFLYTPFLNSALSFTISLDGTLYYLQYDDKGLDVMAYAAR